LRTPSSRYHRHTIPPNPKKSAHHSINPTLYRLNASHDSETQPTTNKTHAHPITENQPLLDTASKVLKLDKPSLLEDVASLCKKAISSIIGKSDKKLIEFTREKKVPYMKRAPQNTTTTSKQQPDCSLKQVTIPTLSSSESHKPAKTLPVPK
jgi:hypothetical protein